MSRRWLLGCALVAAGVLFVPSRADACGAVPTGCAAQWTVRDKVLPLGVNAWPAPYGFESLEVFDGAGARVAVGTITNGVATLDTTLGRGSYTFEGDQKCSGESRPQPFSIGPALPAPTSLGTLSLTAPMALDSVGGSNTCINAKPRRVAVGVTLVYADGFRPYAPLAKVWATVDGKPITYITSEYAGGEERPAPELTSMFVQSVQAGCPGPPVPSPIGTIDHRGFLDEGTHTVEVHGQLAGSGAELPVLTAQVTLSCAAVTFSSADSGEPGGEVSPDDTSGTTCSATPPRRATSVLPLAAIGLGAIVLRRRRATRS